MNRQILCMMHYIIFMGLMIINGVQTENEIVRAIYISTLYISTLFFMITKDN